MAFAGWTCRTASATRFLLAATIVVTMSAGAAADQYDRKREMKIESYWWHCMRVFAYKYVKSGHSRTEASQLMDGKCTEHKDRLNNYYISAGFKNYGEEVLIPIRLKIYKDMVLAGNFAALETR